MIEKKQNRLVQLSILAVIILLIFLHYLKITKTMEDFVFSRIFDAQGQTYAFLTKLKTSFVNYQEAQDLQKNTLELEHKYNQLLYDNSQLMVYKQENEKLRNILQFISGKDFKNTLAKVIGRDSNRSNTLIINRGKNSGLVVGYPVVVDNGIIIGKVIDVKDNLATILLLTDKLSQLAVSTINLNKSIGLASGEYGLSLKVELIPQDIILNQGDLIITSGLEQNIPRGLVIGMVNRIVSSENDLFKTVTINPLANYEEITIVDVIIP